MARTSRTQEAQETRRMVAAILAHYDQATADDALAGLRWYAEREQFCAALSRETGGRLGPEHVAGIVAALSPRIQWSVNIRLARAFVAYAVSGQNPPSGALPLSIARARAIADGAAPLDVLAGPKTRAFYANLCGDVTAVTVDVWAQRAAGDGSRTLTARRYARIADAYRLAALARGVAPRDMQAAVWVHVRGRAS